MINSAELAIQRTLTAAFIRADSISLVLARSSRTADGAGGILVGTAVPLAAQTTRLVPLQDKVIERQLADGRAVTPSYMLIGNFDADLARFDTFVFESRRYEVVFIQQNRQYEVKGEVAYCGE